ncbi:hypothetical protein MH215_23885 [Paenibacillus sp. ACRSA]|uniref:hypothetical protein n=1 Tax=Paenibacillus sp. ACRSA TaxID=2918211 RepID=UPI001EF57538|nr:hypothetical protein [Paenibacillus sp. ACRSA]MCG7380039.1 hypothetical protein [Paenibacillus sp. ACRSA]
MAITGKTRKILWAKSANRCNFKNCRKELCIESEMDKHTVIGQECHIVAKSKKGPRGINDLTTKARDNYKNLILLCGDHHTEIDNDEEKYTVEVIEDIKSKHEKWIKKTLSSEQIEELEFYFDEEVLFDEDYLEEVIEWIETNTDYYEMKKENLKQAINKLSYFDKKTRKLLLSIINYYVANKQIDIRSIFNKLVNDGIYTDSEFFRGIRELDKHEYIEFDDRFEVLEVGDTSIILDGDSESSYKYLHKSCWFDKYGKVFHGLQKYLDKNKKIKELIIDLDYGII